MGARFRSWKAGVVAALICPRSPSVDLAALVFDDAALSAVPKMKSQGSVVSKAIKRVFGIHVKLFYERLDIYYNILSRDILLAGFRNVEGNQHWIHASKHKYLTLPSKRKTKNTFEFWRART